MHCHWPAIGREGFLISVVLILAQCVFVAFLLLLLSIPDGSSSSESELDAQPVVDYSKCTLLHGAPRVGDTIAFKVQYSLPHTHTQHG